MPNVRIETPAQKRVKRFLESIKPQISDAGRARIARLKERVTELPATPETSVSPVPTPTPTPRVPPSGVPTPVPQPRRQAFQASPRTIESLSPAERQEIENRVNVEKEPVQQVLAEFGIREPLTPFETMRPRGLGEGITVAASPVLGPLEILQEEIVRPVAAKTALSFTKPVVTDPQEILENVKAMVPGSEARRRLLERYEEEIPKAGRIATELAVGAAIPATAVERAVGELAGAGIAQVLAGTRQLVRRANVLTPKKVAYAAERQGPYADLEETEQLLGEMHFKLEGLKEFLQDSRLTSLARQVLGPNTEFGETLTAKQVVNLYDFLNGKPLRSWTNRQALERAQELYPTAMTGIRVRREYILDDVVTQYSPQYADLGGVEAFLADVETTAKLAKEASELESAMGNLEMTISGRVAPVVKGGPEPNVLTPKKVAYAAGREGADVGVEATAQRLGEMKVKLEGLKEFLQDSRLTSLARQVLGPNTEFGETLTAKQVVNLYDFLNGKPLRSWTNAQALARAKELYPTAMKEGWVGRKYVLDDVVTQYSPQYAGRGGVEAFLADVETTAKLDWEAKNLESAMGKLERTISGRVAPVVKGGPEPGEQVGVGEKAVRTRKAVEPEQVVGENVFRKPPRGKPYIEVPIKVRKEDALKEYADDLAGLNQELGAAANAIDKALIRQHIEVVSDNIRRVRAVPSETLTMWGYRLAEAGAEVSQAPTGPRELPAKIAGAPEPGIQMGSLGVEDRPRFPGPIGKTGTISMDETLQLQQARAGLPAAPRIEEAAPSPVGPVIEPVEVAPELPVVPVRPVEKPGESVLPKTPRTHAARGAKAREVAQAQLQTGQAKGTDDIAKAIKKPRAVQAKRAVAKAGQGGLPPPPSTGPPGPPAGGGGLGKVMEMWEKPPPLLPNKKYLSPRHMIEQKTLDRFAGINKLDARVRKQLGVKVLPPQMAAEMHTALLGGGAEAGYQRAIDVNAAMLRTLGKGIDTDYVNTYLHLRHAIDIETMKGPQRKIAGGIKGAREARAILDEIAAELGPEAYRRVEAAAGTYRDHYAAILVRKVESGLVAEELADQLRSQYPWYNPIAYLDTLAAEGSGVRESAGTISATRSGLRRLSELGSEAARERPLDTMPRATLEAELLIRRNDAAKAIIKAAQQDPELSKEITRVGATRPVAQVEGQVIFRRPPGEIPGTISTFEEGKRIVWEVPPWMEREMKLLGQMQTGDLEGLGRLLNAIPLMGLTAANPVFFISNFAVDTLTAMIGQGVMPGRMVGRLLKNLRTMATGDATYRSMVLEGGGMTGFSGHSPEQIAKSVRSKGQIALRTPSDWKKWMSSPIESLLRIGHAVEMAPRTATYETLLKRGLTRQQAALEARRVTIDFNRSGTAIRQANALYLYLNAGIQGTVLPLRALRDSPRTRFWVAGLMGATVANYAWNRQFPEYKDVPFYRKYGAMVVMLPSNEYDKRGNKKPHYITIIPNMREWAAFTGPIIYALDHLDNQAPDDMNAFLRQWGAGLNPLGSIIGTSGLPVPTQIGETAVETILNKDLFRDQPIVPPELEGLPAGEQYDQYTSETLRRLGQFIGVSPMKLQHFTRGVFGGLGWQVLGGMDAAIHKAAPEPVPADVQRAFDLLQKIATPQTAPDRIDIERSKFLAGLSVGVREKVLELERRPELRMPVISDLAGRLYHTRGGQLYKTGRVLAAKKTGLSDKQTSEVSRILSRAFLEMDKAEELIAEAVEKGEIEVKGVREPYSREQWVEDHAENGSFYRMALLTLQVMYPSAAQVQEDANAWRDFQAQTYTLAGMMPDSRSRGQLLVVAYRAIQPEGPTASTTDWDEFFERQDQFKAGLEADDRRLFEEQLTANMNPIEREYEADTETLKPYLSMNRRVKQGLSQAQIVLWDQYLKATSVKSAELGRNPAIKDIKKRVAGAKIFLRCSQREIDQLLLKWGRVSRPAACDSVVVQPAAQLAQPAAPSGRLSLEGLERQRQLREQLRPTTR